MRMWMIDPKLLCQRHLFREHCEIHRLVAILRNGFSIRGFLYKRVIDPSRIYHRHNEIEAEIIQRGGTPNSPLSEAECCAFSRWHGSVRIDIGRSLSDLSSCCNECQKRIGKFIYIALNNDRGGNL